MKKIVLIITIIFNSISTLNAQNIKLAILDFENTSGTDKYNGLTDAISFLLFSDIMDSLKDKYELIDVSVFKQRPNLRLPPINSNNLDSVYKIGIELKLDKIIYGRVIVLDENLKLEAKCYNILTREITFSLMVEDSLKNWLILKTDLANKIIEKLN
jgi:TolB-like protein